MANDYHDSRSFTIRVMEEYLSDKYPKLKYVILKSATQEYIMTRSYSYITYHPDGCIKIYAKHRRAYINLESGSVSVFVNVKTVDRGNVTECFSFGLHDADIFATVDRIASIFVTINGTQRLQQ